MRISTFIRGCNQKPSSYCTSIQGNCRLQEMPTVVDGGEEPLLEELPQIEEFDLADILGEHLEERVDTKEDRLRQLAEQVCSLPCDFVHVLLSCCTFGSLQHTGS